MDNSEKDKTPETKYESDLDMGVKRPKLWGSFYLVLGLGGLAASFYSGYNNIYKLVPLFGTVIAAALTSAISILIIIYGYRMMRKDL
jgi:hypothetical protein